MRRGKPEYQVKIARERMDILIDEARKKSKEPELAKRYITLLRKIGMRYNVKVPKEIRRKYCKFCNHYLAGHGQRVKKGIINISCSYCKKTYRIPFEKN
jgi:ribonuclease P protein subunit RPR2